MLPLIPLDPAAVGTVPNRLDRLPDELQLTKNEAIFALLTPNSSVR